MANPTLVPRFGGQTYRKLIKAYPQRLSRYDVASSRQAFPRLSYARRVHDTRRQVSIFFYCHKATSSGEIKIRPMKQNEGG